jgi:hypothetical protein
MKIFRLLAALAVFSLAGCASTHISELDNASVATGEKGAIQMTLAHKGFYDLQTLVVARVDPETRIVDILDAQGKADDKKYGLLRFEDNRLFAVGEPEPITAKAFLYPGYYAPIALDLFQPGAAAAAQINVQNQKTDAPSEVRKFLSKAFGGTPGLAEAASKLDPQSLHGLKIGDNVNVWRVEAGKTLNLGSVVIAGPVFEIDGVKCGNSKDTYEFLIKNEQIKNSKGIDGFLFNTPNKETPIDPDLLAAAKTCPAQKDFDQRVNQVGSFQIKSASTLP